MAESDASGRSDSASERTDLMTGSLQNEGLPLDRQGAGAKCTTCGAEWAIGSGPAFVYALGRVEYRFPSMAVEMELRQVSKLVDSAGLTAQQTEHQILTNPMYRYLARQLCWVFTIEGLETYILVPREDATIDLLLTAIRTAPSPWDIDLVIGRRGPLASPTICNGLTIPMVGVDHIYSFDRDTLIKSIPKAEGITEDKEKQFWSTSNEVFARIMQLADNAGAQDEHRAVNYLAVRYPAIYAKAAELIALDSSITAVDIRPSRLTGVRKILDVVFSFTNRKTDVTDKYFVRVDVTEEFPFLVTKLSPYFDR